MPSISASVSRVARVAMWVIVLGGCGESHVTPPAIKTPVDHRAAIIAQAQAKAKGAGKSVSAHEFLKRNPMGYIAEIHNNGVRASLAAVASDKSGRPCRAIEKALNGGAWLGEAARHVRAEDFSKAGSQVVAAIPACSRVRAAALHAPAKPTLVSDGVMDYLSAMQAAMEETSTSSALATVVSAIVDDAAYTLDANDMELVNAGASFIVGTAVYWEENGATEFAALAGGPIGTCLGVNPENENCIYETRGPRRPRAANDWRALNASFSSPTGASLNFRYAATQNKTCPYYWSGWDVAAGDFGGFLAGLLTLNPFTAVLAGAATSIGVWFVEAVHRVYCIMKHAQ